jgi:hypothetical protein
LGRTGRFRQQFKHRREILRASHDSYTNAYSYGYVYANSYGNAEACTITEASPDSSAPPVKILISLDLQPLLYARAEFLHADLETTTEENVVSTLVRHRPRAGSYLAKMCERNH